MVEPAALRLNLDLGNTKIEAALMSTPLATPQFWLTLRPRKHWLIIFFEHRYW
jgi:hypothetical protein